MTAVPGSVAIVGAGPGDPELLTRRAYHRIQTADVVLHDSLVSDSIVELVPAEAAVLDVGKRPGGERTSQDEINRLMLEEARRGSAVVRLKGGDPFLFGRGGEEIEYLADHDVRLELVPGVSSVLAGPAVAGIPLTHRDHASSLTVVTGHEDPTKPDSALDWAAIGRTVSAGGTLVILMGVRRLPDNVEALLANGVPTETPAALIEQATLPGEFTVSGTLETIEDRAQSAGIAPPAVTVVGDVVRIGESVAGCLGSAPAAGVLAAYAAGAERGVRQ